MRIQKYLVCSSVVAYNNMKDLALAIVAYTYVDGNL